MRTIKELLILLREELPKQIDYKMRGSICLILLNLKCAKIISVAEYHSVNDYINEHVPPYVVNREDYWWPRNALRPRLEFLDKPIAEL